jgi:hypothetical protein
MRIIAVKCERSESAEKKKYQTISLLLRVLSHCNKQQKAAVQRLMNKAYPRTSVESCTLAYPAATMAARKNPPAVPVASLPIWNIRGIRQRPGTRAMRRKWIKELPARRRR